MKEPVDYGDLDAALDLVVGWLIAAYCARLERIAEIPGAPLHWEIERPTHARGFAHRGR